MNRYLTNARFRKRRQRHAATRLGIWAWGIVIAGLAFSPATFGQPGASGGAPELRFDAANGPLVAQAPPAEGGRDAGDPAPASAGQAAGRSAQITEGRLQLLHTTPANLHQRLEKALGRSLPLEREANSPWMRFAIEAGEGAPLMATTHTATGELRLLGRPDQVAAWRKVISALDAAPRADQTTQAVVTHGPARPQIREAVATLLAQGTGDAGVRGGGVADAQGSQANGGEENAASTNLLGPVQVEFVEGTDILILRGNPRDVERVEAIIRQIEGLTQREPPLIKVRPLRFVDSTTMARLLDQAFALDNPASLAPVYGKPLAFPLYRPNGVLLIGGSPVVGKAEELLTKLDVRGDETWQFEVFRLAKAMATDAQNVLERLFVAETDSESPVFRPRALIIADARSNAIIARAGAQDMAEIRRLLDEIDRTATTSGLLKVFPIENGDATALRDMLQSLFGSQEGNQGGGGGNGGGGTGGENARKVASLRFSVDERTNSILAFGSSEDLVVVEAILLRLDAADSRERRNYVYHLKNANAEDVALALQDAMQAERDVQQTAPGAASPFEQIEREIVVVPELASNSLIVSASPRAYKDIVRVIEELDQQAPMVMIQVLIGELRLGDADEFGVELGLQDSLLFDRSLLSGLETTNTTTTLVQPGGGQTIVEQEVIQGANLTPGFNWGDARNGLGNSGSDLSRSTAGKVASQGLSSFALNRINPDLGFGGLVLSASSDSMSMLLRALQESRRLEILSRPQIMALDGQIGNAFVGEIVPLISSSTLNTFGNPQNVVERVNVGLGLTVEPRISPDGLVVMRVQAVKSELGRIADGVPIAVGPNGQPINQPRIAETSADTVISAVRGQTIVMSGLLTKRDFALHRRLPILADIPLLGALFRFDSTSTERTELLVILTPHIVRGRHEAELLKQTESARMSWCLADVVDLHGPAGLRSRSDAMGAAEAETIFPQHMPAEGEFIAPQWELPTPTTVPSSSPTDEQAPTPSSSP